MTTQPLLRLRRTRPDAARARVLQPAWSLMLALGVGFSGCGGDTTAPPVSPPPPPPTVASVTVTPATLTLHTIGETVQLTATARAANGTAIPGKTFTWACSDDAIASVSASGQVTAKLHGAVTITATTEGFAGTTTVQVQLVSTTVDVGPSGGQVEIEGFALTVPPGAFDAVSTVSVDTTSEGEAVDGLVSGWYRVRGLPETYAAPLAVRIEYDGSLTDNSYLVLSEWAIHELQEDTVLVPRLLPATDSSGFLIGELPGHVAAPQSSSPSAHRSTDSDRQWLDRTLTTRTGMKQKVSEHFRVYHHSSLPEHDIGELSDSLETIVAAIEGMGLLDGLWWLPWPVDVHLRIVERSRNTGCDGFVDRVGWLADNRAKNSVVVFVSRDAVARGQFHRIKPDVGTNFTWLSLREWSGGKYDYSPDSPWFLEKAVLCWSEEQFSVAQPFTRPRDFLRHAMDPFHGFKFALTRVSPGMTGSGMAPVIKYLVADTLKFGEAGIRHTFDKIRLQGMRPPDALLQTVNAPPAEWWPDFFQKYVAGEIYGVPTDTFTANVSGTWDVKSGETEQAFDMEYPDLSAKLFLIKLNADAIEPSVSMLLSTNGQLNDALATIVYGLKDDGTRTYLGMARSADFEVPELKDYYDDGWKQFLVVVVNSDPSSLTGTRYVELRVEVGDCLSPEGSPGGASSSSDVYTGVGTSVEILTRSAEHALGAGSVTCHDTPGYEFRLYDDGTMEFWISPNVFATWETLTCVEYIVPRSNRYTGGTHANGEISWVHVLGYGGLTGSIVDGVLSGEMRLNLPFLHVTEDWVYTFENLGKVCPAFSTPR